MGLSAEKGFDITLKTDNTGDTEMGLRFAYRKVE